MFEQVKLTYDFNALEPHIDELTMQTHYGKAPCRLYQQPEQRPGKTPWASGEEHRRDPH